VDNTRLVPYWAIYISTRKLDIPDLVSLYNTTQLVLQSWLQSWKTDMLAKASISVFVVK